MRPFEIPLALLCLVATCAVAESRGDILAETCWRPLLFSARWRSTLYKVHAGFFMPTPIGTGSMARRHGHITLQLPEREANYRHIPIRCSCLEGCKQPADATSTDCAAADIATRLILLVLCRLAVEACEGGSVAKMSRRSCMICTVPYHMLRLRRLEE